MKTILFDTPVDASNYIAGAGEVKGIKLRGVDYEGGNARFSLINADDSVRSEVNGIAITDPENATDESIAADVRDVIAATNA